MVGAPSTNGELTIELFNAVQKSEAALSMLAAKRNLGHQTIRSDR